MLKSYQTAPGAPAWIELETNAPTRAAEFYAEIFGWAVADRRPDANADFWHQRARIAGLRATHTGTPLGWVVYLAAARVPPVVQRVERQGGSVLWSDGSASRAASLGVVRDEVGAVVGIAEAGAVPAFDRVAEPGAPCWFELCTSRFDQAVDFYADALCWPMRLRDAEPPRRSASHGRGHSQRTSLIEAPSSTGPPASQWWIHFGTADCAGTLGRIEQLGGTVLAPVAEAAGSRMASAADPMGAVFRLVEVPTWPTDDGPAD